MLDVAQLFHSIQALVTIIELARLHPTFPFYLTEFLQRRQQTTTRTRRRRQTDDMDQKAICRGESGSHQNWRRGKREGR